MTFSGSTDITTSIDGCIDNDSKHQRIVYELYRAYALKIVFRYVYSYEKAVDVVNDGFVKLFKHFSGYEKGLDDAENSKKLAGWIKKIMINTAIDELRKNKNAVDHTVIPEDIWDLTNKTDDADQSLLYKELVLLIKNLPSNYRTVFNLYIIDGFSHAEIADMLHTTVSNTKSMLARARIMLKESLKSLQEGKWNT